MGETKGKKYDTGEVKRPITYVDEQMLGQAAWTKKVYGCWHETRLVGAGDIGKENIR